MRTELCGDVPREEGSALRAECANVHENVFLVFRYQRFDFAVPLTDVARIAENVPENARVVDAGNPVRYYVLSLTEDILLAIGADEVYGLATIPPQCQYEMPAEALTPENEWIFGAAYDGESDRTVFLLDCHVLAKRQETEMKA